jgi:8-oxo-dGTP diphosphatase
MSGRTMTGLRRGRWRPEDLCVNGTPVPGRPRRAVRAVILAEDDRILLCRFSFPRPAVPTGATGVWAAPGVWHQQVAAPSHPDGYDGVLNDYFLVRTTRFDPHGALSDDDLAAEHISGMRWWRQADIAEYGGTDLFSPRDIARPLAALIAGDIPGTPVMLGL